MTRKAQYRASERALLTELGDGTGVLLDLDSKFYFTLNETAIFVWKTLSGGAPATEDELAARLTATFEVDMTRAREDLAPVLELLGREHLVSIS